MYLDFVHRSHCHSSRLVTTASDGMYSGVMREGCYGMAAVMVTLMQQQHVQPIVAVQLLMTLDERPCTARWVVRCNSLISCEVYKWRSGWAVPEGATEMMAYSQIGHWMQLANPEDAAEMPCLWAVHPDQWCSTWHCDVALQPLKAGGVAATL